MEGNKKVMVGSIGIFSIALFILLFLDIDWKIVVMYSILSLCLLLWIVSGTNDLQKSEGRVAATIKDGSYIIISFPFVETWVGRSNYSEYTDIRKFDFQNAKVDSIKSVHLIAKIAHGSERYFEIPRENISREFWPLLLPFHMIIMENGTVKHIYKPGEYE